MSFGLSIYAMKGNACTLLYGFSEILKRKQKYLIVEKDMLDVLLPAGPMLYRV